MSAAPDMVGTRRHRDAEPAAGRAMDARKHKFLAQSSPAQSDSIADVLVTKDWDLYLLCGRDGQVPLSGEHGVGLYYHDCRFVGGYEFQVQGRTPQPLVATLSHGAAGVLELAASSARGTQARKTDLSIRLSRVLDGDGLVLHDGFTLRNLGDASVSVSLVIRFRAAFEDISVVRRHHDERPGTLHAPRWGRGVLAFRYDGSDGIVRRADVTFSTPPRSVTRGRARFHLRIKARRSAALGVSIAVSESGPGQSPPKRGRARSGGEVAGEHEHGIADRLERRARFWSDNPQLNEIMDRALRDLEMLRSRLRGLEFYCAGTPWFATLFGRDSLVAALQMLAFDPAVAEQTLRLLASLQGERHDGWRDEQPGKILHELRVGELARTGRTPHGPYYGSIDATPLFLILLCRHARWTGRLDLFRELRGAADGALRWMGTDGQPGGLGYLAYDSTVREGLINQGWKDSGNAIINEDGSLGRPPIAPVEVQGYAYAARVELADLFARDGDTRRAGALREDAAALRERFHRDFWLPDLGFHAMALQARGEPIHVVSSNPGQALWAGIIEPRRARAVADRLMAPDMFSGWGVRCLSEKCAAYNPIGYHLGTVWPHDNSLIAAGFRRYGFDDAALRVFGAMTEAAAHFTACRLPEVFAGFPREPLGVPVRYPVACHPQAWASAAVPYMLEALLGLEPEAFAGRLRVVRPLLPVSVDLIVLSGVRVGTARADLEFRRDPGGKVRVRVLGTRGPLRIDVEDVPRTTPGKGGNHVQDRRRNPRRDARPLGGEGGLRAPGGRDQRHHGGPAHAAG